MRTLTPSPQAPTNPQSEHHPRKRLTGEERRAAILDSALAVFAERGYHASSIDDIAREGGVSKALIYEHFASKPDLYAELLEHQAGQLFSALAEAISGGRPIGLRRGSPSASTPSTASSRSTGSPGGCCSARPPTPRPWRCSTGSRPR